MKNMMPNHLDNEEQEIWNILNSSNAQPQVDKEEAEIGNIIGYKTPQEQQPVPPVDAQELLKYGGRGGALGFDAVGNILSYLFNGMSLNDYHNLSPDEKIKNLNYNASPEEQIKILNDNPRIIRHQMVAEPNYEPYVEKYDRAFNTFQPLPHDKIRNVAQTAGEFLLPLPGSGYLKAGKMGAKALGKTFGKELIGATGASTAIHNAPKMTKEDTLGRSVEDFAHSIIGARGAHKLTGTAGNIANSLAKNINEGTLKKNIKEYPIKAAGRFAGKFSDPNQLTHKLTKKYGIDVPVSVGSGNRGLKWIENNFLKSMFASKAYKETFAKADKQMFDKFKSSLNTLGVDNIKPATASAQYRDFLKSEKKDIKDKVNELYNDAVLKSGKSDTVIPENTIKDIHKFREILDRDIRAPETLKVAKVFGELADKWGLLNTQNNKIVKQLREKGYEDPALLSKILKNIDQKPPIELGRLNEVRQELGDMIFDQDLRGPKKLLKVLRDSVTKDIESVNNPEFIEKWKGANKFYHENVVSRVESDLAHSMLTGEAPKEAFDAMNSVKGIQLIGEIAGNSPKGIQVFNDLKKAKLRDIFKNSIDGDFDEGRLRKAAFAKIFQKGEKNQDVIQELIGKKEYKKLNDLAKISSEFSSSGSELLNTSGTALVGADMDRAQTLAKETLNTLFGSAKVAIGAVPAGYSFYGSAGALGGAIASVASPFLLSELVANPIFVKEARDYAFLRKAGKEKEARSTLNRLFRVTTAESRRSLPQISKIIDMQESKEEEE